MSYPHDHENEVTYFARTNFRNQLRKFGVKTDDRRRHVYVIGKTGMGKTVLLENMILSDIYSGHGCCYVDPHGDTAERLIDFIPSWRINDVIYFNPADLDFPIGFNILETVNDKHKHLVASGMMGVFKKIWENLWSARMEYILNNSILALLDNPGSTLLGINRMLSDADFRRKIVANVQDPIVKQFWLVEFASYQEKYAQEAVAPIQNKIGQFLSASVIRNIVAQVKSTINIRQLMDQEKIIIINLSKGRIGEDNMRLLGGLLITKMQLSAMERVDIPEEERKDFYMYVDEFQNFAVESFASILSEARKYRLCLTMAHQYIAQLSDEVREAVFGNVGTTITFRVGSPDATYMETEFAPRFTPEDIINLPKYNIYLKLLIDGVTSHPFSAQTLPPIAKRTGSTDKVIRVSRERYTTPRMEIAEKILKWTGMGSEESIAEKMAEVEARKKEAKAAKKPRFEYKCSRCGKDMVLPVQLDTSRPIYCEQCIELVRDERKTGIERKFDRKPFAPPPPPPLRAAPLSPTPVVAAKPRPAFAPRPIVQRPIASVPRPIPAGNTVGKLEETRDKISPEPVVSATSSTPSIQQQSQASNNSSLPKGDDFLALVMRSPLATPPATYSSENEKSGDEKAEETRDKTPATAATSILVPEKRSRRRRKKSPSAMARAANSTTQPVATRVFQRVTPPLPPSGDGFVSIRNIPARGVGTPPMTTRGAGTPPMMADRLSSQPIAPKQPVAPPAPKQPVAPPAPKPPVTPPAPITPAAPSSTSGTIHSGQTIRFD